MPQMLVGIDVDLRSNHVRFMDNAGNSLASFSVSNDLPGAGKLAARIKAASIELDIDSVKIGMEATSNLGWHLAHFLNQEIKNHVLNTKVYVLNARKVARFKKGYDSLPKNDRLDAWVIADHLRFGRLSNAMSDAYEYEALQRLTRTRYHMMKTLTREKTYCLNNVFLKFSSLRTDSPFSDSFGTTSLAVIEELEPEQICEMPMEDLIDFLQQKGNNHFADPQQIALDLKKIARSSYRLNKGMADPVNIALRCSLNTIKFLESEIKHLDREIARLIKNIPQTLTSVKGIGDVLASGIISEIGDIKRFKDHNALAKYAGLSWNEHQSGQFVAEDTPRTKTGNKYLRYYLIQTANSLRRNDPVYENFYHKKFAEVPKHQHKRALVLTARKLVRLVYSLLCTRQLYTLPERGN